MDLFVVNRHLEEEEDKEENAEQAKLISVLKKIEKKTSKLIKKEKFQELKQKTTEIRQLKRKAKAKIIQLPENEVQSFIEPNLVDDEKDEEVVEKSKRKRKIQPENIEGFTVLGADNFAQKTKVKRVLPRWLTTPTVISVNLQDLKTKISSVPQLDKSLKELLKKNGVKFFFPVQAEVIPWLLETNKHSDVIFPRDICVSAPTGSGKTLAFVLPIIQALKRHSRKCIRALIMLPTQDLAFQVFKSFQLYIGDSGLDVSLAAGKNTFEAEQEQLISNNDAFGLVSKCDILVCTAGRLVDHLKFTAGFNLSNLEYLVIDEADRVLENVQNDWLYHLEQHINTTASQILNLFTLERRRPPQKLLFSATLSQDPEKLQMLSLFQPKLFTSVVENDDNESVVNTDTFIGKYTTPRELEEKYIVTSVDLKPLVLYKFIKRENLTKTLIFAHSTENAHRLTILLRALFGDEMKIEEISSTTLGPSRTKLIKNFTSGKIDLLVCTDALARGIDLSGVKCVISYSAPKYVKTYIHRVGRTARAGEQGLAVTLLTKGNVKTFMKLLQQAGKQNLQEIAVYKEDLEPLGDKYRESLEELKEIVANEKKAELQKKIEAKNSKKIKAKNPKKIKSKKTNNGKKQKKSSS